MKSPLPPLSDARQPSSSSPSTIMFSNINSILEFYKSEMNIRNVLVGNIMNLLNSNEVLLITFGDALGNVINSPLIEEEVMYEISDKCSNIRKAVENEILSIETLASFMISLTSFNEYLVSQLNLTIIKILK